MAKASAPCKGCGADIFRDRRTAPIRSYCTPDCRPRCLIEDCEKPQHSKGYCSAHASRAAKYGDPLAPLLRTPNGGLLCDVEGCGQPRRKRTWCASHYSQWVREGEVRPFRKKWATDRTCVVCGGTSTERGRRKFCSAACTALWVRHAGQVPVVRECVGCGKRIELATGARRINATVKLCRRCRIDKRKHGVSVEQLAVRDGIACGICGEDVDMAAAKTDRMRPSVDHAIPRARGGTNDPSNLQLSHLWCNQVKSDRMDGDPVLP